MTWATIPLSPYLHLPGPDDRALCGRPGPLRTPTDTRMPHCGTCTERQP